MKYYLIEFSADEAEIGSTYPQSHTARHIINVNDPQYLGKHDIGKPLPNDIVLPQPVLHPDAKLTDLISSTATWRLTMSSKLKSILERHVDPNRCQFLPMTVHCFSSQYGYWMLNPIVFDMETIDFPNAEIWVVGIGNAKIRPLHCSNAIEFEQYGSQLVIPETLSILKFKFHEGVSQDFIQLRRVPRGIAYYVSHDLKNEIIGAGCTGLKFTGFTG
ncbi:MAG: hypothetical protein JO301_03725 [Chitinophagaceae bacterium]|nr:hypothetical protein [Chitinophagaceae bacterium]